MSDNSKDSALKTTIGDATKTAMKARDKARVAALRMVNAEIKRVEVDERRDLSDDDILSILNKMVKQRQDALTQFRDAKRDDLAEQEEFELAILSEFMPEQLDESAVAELVAKCIADTGAKGMQDMGKVMGALKAAAGNQLDMGQASALVKAQLSQS